MFRVEFHSVYQAGGRTKLAISVMSCSSSRIVRENLTESPEVGARCTVGNVSLQCALIHSNGTAEE
jgi:hypothetical protein